MSKIFRFMVLCSVLLLCAAMAFAASQNAVVYGTVYDASAKPLGGVKVMLENPGIALARTTVTAADGSYSFSEVPPASGYKVSASQNGSVIDARTGITVNVGEESVIFPALKASATPRPAETSAMNMPVSTDKVATAQSGVITGEQLRSLPLYNRNFLTLGTLTPHTHPSGAADPLGDASFSVAGNRSTANAFLLDGADNRASSTNQAVPFQVNDAIQEFRVVSSAGNAEYGANGGTVNVVTKRGSNNWHGTAFGYFGADVLNSDGPLSIYNGSTFDQAAAFAGNPATTTVVNSFDPIGPMNYNDYVNSAENFGWCTDQISFFTGVAGPNTCNGPGWSIGGTGFNTRFDPAAIRATNDQFKTPWNSQQFGANIGGPLMKNRVFIFAGYEGTHLDNPNPIFERVPTAFDRTYDPYGFGVNFAPNDPNYVIGQNVLGLFPGSNVVGVPGVLEFFRGEAPNHTMVHNGIGRVDWVYGPRDSFGLRWVGQWLDQLHDDTLPAGSSYPGNGADRTAFNQNVDINYTHVFSSMLVNQAHAGFNRFKLQEQAQDRNFDATVLGFSNPTMMTFLLSGIDPQYSGQTPVSQGAIGGWSDSCFGGADGTAGCWSYAPGLDGLFPYARLGAPLYAPSKSEDWSWFGADSVSWTKGRHQFKFGGEYRHYLNNVMDGGLNRGMVYSGNIGQFIADSETCNLECDEAFFAPTFDYMQKNLSPWNVDLNSHSVAFFAEDTIRAYSRLTVTLGIRWEYFSRPLDQHDQLWNFDPTANGLVQQGSTSVVNQAGNVCGGPVTPTQFPIDIPLAGGFFTGANAWDCQTSGKNALDHTHWTDFMPRVGMAWDIFGDGKTVARFGVGMFYDRQPTTYTSQLMKNRPIVPFAPDSSSNGIPLFTGVGTQLPQAFYGGLFNQFGFGNSNLDPAVMVAGFPFQFFGSAAQPGAMYGRDINHDSDPRVWQVNANIQHQFTNNFVAEAGYVGSYGGKLPTFFNQGFANEWFCNSSGTFSGTCDNNSFSPVFMQTNQGESQYNSVYVRARVAEWHGLRLNGTYTFSHARDNASSLVFPNLPVSLFGGGCGPQFWANNNPLSCSASAFGAGSASTPSVMPLTTTGASNIITTPYLIPQDSGNFLRNDYGRSDYNSDHRFVLDWTYDVPSVQKMWGWSKYADYWQLSGITILQSGQPYTIFSLIGGELSQRANASGPVATGTDPNNAISTANLAPAFLTCGPAIPDAGFFFASDGSQGTSCNGNTARNAFTGPMYSTFNVAIQKGFPIGGEGKMLDLRSEFYNLFGADNFYNPVSLLSTNGFSINPDFGKIKSAHDPRQIQFAVRFTW